MFNKFVKKFSNWKASIKKEVKVIEIEDDIDWWEYCGKPYIPQSDIESELYNPDERGNDYIHSDE